MNHYDALGLARDASSADIKAAFRRLASENHPDKGGGADAMAAINRAHEVLIDPERRKAYDATGSDADSAERARSMLLQLFAQHLAGEEPLLDAVRASITKELHAAALHKAEALGVIERLTRRRATIKTAGDNLVHQIIDGQVQQLTRTIANAEAFVAQCNAALPMLAEYSSTEDVSRAQAFNINSFIFTMGGAR